MESLRSIKERFPDHYGLIKAQVSVLNNPVLLLDEAERLIGCNEALLAFKEVASLAVLQERYKSVADLFVERENVLSARDAGWAELAAAHEGLNVILHDAKGAEHFFSVRIAKAPIRDTHLYIINLEDRSQWQKALNAQRYFETFKHRFLTSISHEFRTPMNGIIGFVDLLRNTVLNPTQTEYAANIASSAKTMMKNIENLLELMQIDSGTVTLNETVFKPVEGFEEFASKFCEEAKQKGVMVYFMIDPRLPYSMLGDAGKIKRVLKNLISNGVKFTEKGGQVFVEIRVKSYEKGAVSVEYSVTDTGEGIAPERLNTILRPFAAGPQNQVRGKDGFGIGLSVSNKLLAILETTLKVASEIGKGSRFSFTLSHQVNEESRFETVPGTKALILAEDHRNLPQGKLLANYLKLFGVEEVKEIDSVLSADVARSDALFIITPQITRAHVQSLHEQYRKLRVIPVITADEPKTLSRMLDSAESIITMPILPNGVYDALGVIWKKLPKNALKAKMAIHEPSMHERIKILLAEDNPINLKLLQTLLLQQHYQVTAVENGQQAVDIYMNEPFDLILMDIDMPVMDGITANRLIKEIDKRDSRPWTPVIALTAHALEGDRERIMSAGLDAHIPKPVDKEHLLRVLENFIDKKAQRASA